VVESPKPPKVHQAPPPKVVTVHARESAPVQVIISQQERQVIREYVVLKRGNGHGDDDDRGNGKGKKGGKSLPPGQAKKLERGHDLPPGWQNKCVRGQTMPAEIYRHCEPLPQHIAVKLPAPPAGTVIVTIEGKAVRLMQATLEILDVFDVI